MDIDPVVSFFGDVILNRFEFWIDTNGNNLKTFIFVLFIIRKDLRMFSYARPSGSSPEFEKKNFSFKVFRFELFVVHVCGFEMVEFLTNPFQAFL